MFRFKLALEGGEADVIRRWNAGGGIYMER